jgi:predicted dehydrogenase
MNLIIGTGRVFNDYYYPNLKNKSNYKFFDNNPSEISQNFKDRLINKIDKNKTYETIYILTPPSTHFQLIQDLHSIGKSFYVEKPTFSSLIEYETILGEVKDSKIVGGHSRRFFSNYLCFKDFILNEMKDSKITSISAFEGSPYNWNPQKLESILDDEFTHLVDSILFITGMEETNLEVQIKKINNDSFKEISVESLVNSMNVDIQYSRSRQLINQINIKFENGVSYHLNTNLNGEILKIKNNNIHILNNGNKQSALGVFSEVIDYMENFSKNNVDKYNLLKFKNTLTAIDAINEKIKS